MTSPVPQEAPVSNIGAAGRRSRLVFGVAVLVLTVATGVLMLVTGTARWTRVLLAIPFLLGALGVFQARESTCVVHARRGTRELPDGEKPIDDPDLVARLRRRAGRVWAFSAGVAVGLTLVTLLI